MLPVSTRLTSNPWSTQAKEKLQRRCTMHNHSIVEPCLRTTFETAIHFHRWPTVGGGKLQVKQMNPEQSTGARISSCIPSQDLYPPLMQVHESRVAVRHCVAMPCWLAPSRERAPHTHEQTIFPASACAWPRAANVQRTRNCSVAADNASSSWLRRSEGAGTPTRTRLSSRLPLRDGPRDFRIAAGRFPSRKTF